MGKTKRNNKNNESPILRFGSGLILIVLSVWLAFSIVTYSQYDFREGDKGFIYPPPRPIENWGGPAGAKLSFWLLPLFGYLGLAIPITLFVLGIFRFSRKKIATSVRTVAGIIAGHGIISALFALPEGEISHRISGEYGASLVHALKYSVGSIGAYAIIIVIFIMFFSALARFNLLSVFDTSFRAIKNLRGRISASKQRRMARKTLSREDILAQYESKAKPSELRRDYSEMMVPGETKAKEKQENREELVEEEPVKKGKASIMEFIPPPIKRIDKVEKEKFSPVEDKRISPLPPPPPPPAPAIDPQKIIEEFKRKEIQKSAIAPEIIKDKKQIDAEFPEPIVSDLHPQISHEPPLPEPVPPEAPDTETAFLGVLSEPIKPEKIQQIKDRVNIPSAKYIYTAPPLELLIPPDPDPKGMSDIVLQEQALKLMKTLENFGVKGIVKEICPGPVITRYEMEPAEGVKVSRISSLADDIALSLKAQDIRIIAPVPGKGTVGIEVPNEEIQTVRISAILGSEAFKKTGYTLPMALGKRVDGDPAVVDLAKMPHLLIAGATGSGKSVCINSIITSLFFARSPVDVRFILIDPKRLELSIYQGVPHLSAPIVVEPKHAAIALNWAVKEMEDRYKNLSSVAVRSIADYNALAETKGDELCIEKLPYIIIVVDELADLMALVAQEIEEPIARLAQMSRAVGIHLVIATQRPSVDVITGLIKANFPSRIAFKVRSKIDSRTILDMSGAERLLGHGDMLYLPSGYAEPIRIHGSLITTAETEKIVKYLKDFPNPYPENILNFEEEEAAKSASGERDEFFWDAAKIVVMFQQGSTSFLQRKLRVGYTRAGCIVDQLESAGILGPFQGSKAREVLIKDLETLEKLKNEETL